MLSPSNKRCNWALSLNRKLDALPVTKSTARRGQTRIWSRNHSDHDPCLTIMIHPWQKTISKPKQQDRKIQSFHSNKNLTRMSMQHQNNDGTKGHMTRPLRCNWKYIHRPLAGQSRQKRVVVTPLCDKRQSLSTLMGQGLVVSDLSTLRHQLLSSSMTSSCCGHGLVVSNWNHLAVVRGWWSAMNTFLASYAFRDIMEISIYIYIYYKFIQKYIHTSTDQRKVNREKGCMTSQTHE